MYKISETYQVACAKAGCTMKDVCLRQQLYLRIVDTESVVSIVNPRIVTANEKCPYLVKPRTIRYAKGFMRMLETLNVKKLDEFRWRMISKTNRNKYFKLRKGEILLTPEEQQKVFDVLHEIGLNIENPFDSYVEKGIWENV